MKNLSKLICTVTLTFALLLTACATNETNTASVEASGSNITVTVNGNSVVFDQQPIILEGRTLVPVRAIFEALGASVDWNSDTQTVTSTRNDITVALTIGNKVMQKNGISYELDVPAQMVNDRTLVPARAIAEAFGSNVDWNGDTQTVIIIDDTKLTTQVALNHTYTTKLSKTVTSPEFSFDYSDNWIVTEEPLNSAPSISEKVTLSNSRGAEITYMSFGSLGGGGKSISVYDVTEVADSQFVPTYAIGTDKDFSYLGKFMVGAVKLTGEYDMKTGELMAVDGSTYYAVMPESYTGTHEATGLSGFYEKFSFEYAGNYIFYAQYPEGGFTDEEKAEVIKILSSFRVNN